MATGAAGKITEYTDPPVIFIGTVFTPTAGANIIANINRLIDGNGVTLKALQIDGTGNNAVTAPSGVVQVSGTGVQATLPTPAPLVGGVFKDLLPSAAVTFSSSGSAPSISNAYNITSAVRNSTGNYTFTFVTSLSRTPIAMVASATAGFITCTITSTTITITTANTSNTATDYNSPVHFTLLGGF